MTNLCVTIIANTMPRRKSLFHDQFQCLNVQIDVVGTAWKL